MEWPPSGHESRSPHPSHRANALASPHLVEGIGPRADWPRLKSETGFDSGSQDQNISLPAPPVNLLGEPASGLSDDNRPALVKAEPGASSARMIPHRCRSLSPSLSLQLTHPHQVPILGRGADRFSGKQFSCFEIGFGLTKNHAAGLRPGMRLVRQRYEPGRPAKWRVQGQDERPEDGPALIPPAGRRHRARDGQAPKTMPAQARLTRMTRWGQVSIAKGQRGKAAKRQISKEAKRQGGICPKITLEIGHSIP